MPTPYSNLPPSRYWRSAVAEAHPLHVQDLYRKKFPIGLTDRIATAGSCFAQHVARHLKARGYHILDAEPPIQGISDELAKKFGYSIYSARYGNIYTARQLLQLLNDCETLEVRDEDVWERNGRFFDALRPAVEPEGLDTREEVLAHRKHHLQRVDQLVSGMDVLVFTLGLTEAWMNRDTGTIYPTCPGVIAGQYDESRYQFINFDVLDVLEDMKAVREKLKKRSPSLRILLTVSPVPLTATAADEHILVATTYSKSVLRAVCGSMTKLFDDVDYFPSYELIASSFSRGFFYETNMRNVTTGGVETVMKSFFAEHSETADQQQQGVVPPASKVERRQQQRKNDVVCEEALLEAFSK